jgi:hypothetical protein
MKLEREIMTNTQKIQSETYDKELTLEELFQLIVSVEYRLKDYIWELKQEIQELKNTAHFHDNMNIEK